MRPALGLALVPAVLVGAYHFFVVWQQHRMETVGVRSVGVLVFLLAAVIGGLVALGVRRRHRAAACAGLIVLLPTITGLRFTRFAWAVDQTWAWAASVLAAMASAWLFAE